MDLSNFSRLVLAVAITSFGIASVSSTASAQTPVSSAEPASATLTKQQARAKRKAARKTARAKNSAELKQLRSNGYKPEDNRQAYPQNIQDSQKKGGSTTAASAPQ